MICAYFPKTNKKYAFVNDLIIDSNLLDKDLCLNYYESE